MTNPTHPTSLPHEWSKDAYYNKALLNCEEMFANEDDPRKFGLWSTFVLESLARAALSNVSPTLLADSKAWDNLYYSLGHTPRGKRFLPKSIDMAEVVHRLEAINPEFTQEMAGFVTAHLVKRNGDLHSGGTPFAGVDNAAWLPRFYEVCNVLLKSLGKGLDEFLGVERSQAAKEMIVAANDHSAKAVLGTIEQHKREWLSKSPADKQTLERNAEAWALRSVGHRTCCPACNSKALVLGSPMAPPVKSIDGDVITEKQSQLPYKFECIACGLKIFGYSQLHHAGLGNPFTSTTSYDAVEYYAPDDDLSEAEPDYNEPY